MRIIDALILGLAFAFFATFTAGATVPAGYIMCESDGGLSNRLRAMISHMYLAKVLHNVSNLVMIWDVNDACPGHFLQILKPLANVTFISSSERGVFEPNAVQVYPNSRAGFERTMLNHGVNHIVKRFLWWKIELSYWEQLKWVREVNSRVEDFVSLHAVCNMTAMHIRKTDLEQELKHKQRSSYVHFYRWVDAQPESEPVYLMTDNPSTQQHFLAKYGTHKIRVYANISSPTNPALSSIHSTGLGAQSNVTVLPAPVNLAVDHRFTTLEHAAIDILIAAHAKDFRPSAFSSVSDLVRMMKFLHRWEWCG